MPMVSYQTLTAIAFEVAREKGAEFEGERPENARAVIEIVSTEWNDEKDEYRQMTESQAKTRLRGVIEVNR